ncbi:MAG: hypothetical protein LBM09_02095 [Candidatus Nomurabacteria bacterium]|jgi:MraZ protein|nr:hypothetical protein [Candidatus Nomurabacteria bacterium]
MSKIDYFERKLDDKNRLTLPAEIRDELENGAFVTRGVTGVYGKSLHLYPREVWDKDVESRLQSDDIFDERIAELNVQLRMGKTEVNPDEKQGRIRLEQHLLDYAGIKRDLVAVKAGKYWRIMAKEATM